MHKKIFIALLVLIGLAGCKAQTALKYSQGLVKRGRSIVPEMTTTEEKVKTFFGNKQYDSIAVVAIKMEKMVDEKLQEINDEPAPDVTGAPVFKDAFIKYFKFIKSLYTGYKEFGKAANAEEREKALVKVSTFVDHKEAALKDIQDAQQKFASDNGFKLEEK